MNCSKTIISNLEEKIIKETENIMQGKVIEDMEYDEKNNYQKKEILKNKATTFFLLLSVLVAIIAVGQLSFLV